MKVLLLKDVFKLGRAGEVKRVADGFGRNYLLPQGLAVLATPGALKQAEHIRTRADVQRKELNKELSGVAEKLDGMVIAFPARASETGKLYGSVTSQMIAEAITQKAEVEISRRQIDTQPLRSLGEHTIHVRLTVDLIPTLKVIVHREGEAVLAGDETLAEEEAQPAAAEAVEEAKTQAEVDVSEPEAAVEEDIEIEAETELEEEIEDASGTELDEDIEEEIETEVDEKA
jgi:large subunit ribosomal protein L9